jgi:phospholipase D1/2
MILLWLQTNLLLVSVRASFSTMPLNALIGLRHRDEWLEKGRRFRQRFHRGEDWEPQEEDHPHEEPHGGCNVQAVRSCSDWSHGVLKEHSIQNACM